MRATTWIVMVSLSAFLGYEATVQGQPKERPAWIPKDATVHRDLIYSKVGKIDLHLDLILPAKAKGPTPLVLWVHGGGWSAGNKNSIPGNLLLENGFAVASVQYRLSGQAIFPAAIQDCKAAIRWLRAGAKKYNLDPKHFGVWGASAGGHLVALLGTSGGEKAFDVGDNLEQSSSVQAVVDWFGPVDFLTMNAQAKESGIKGPIDHDSPNSPESRFIGGAVQKNKEKAAKASPLTYVSKNTPPMLIMHGDRDPLVPPAQSKQLEAALKKVNVEVELVVLKGSGHGGPAFNSETSRKQILAFFKKHLQK